MGLACSGTFRAQNGEDRWLDDFFAHKTTGYFVEVGAYDGVHLSNTYHFEQIGWCGVLVEPDPEKAAACRASRLRSKVYQCAAVGSTDLLEVTFHQVIAGEVFSTATLTDDHARRIASMGLQPVAMRVPARTLDAILEDAGATKVDFVSIDVEGGELDVLRGFAINRWQPAVVVIESNAKARSPHIRHYFVSHGYAYRHSIDVNDFYVRSGRGPAMTSIIDAARYTLHRGRRRLRRLLHNLRRSWEKRFGKV